MAESRLQSEHTEIANLITGMRLVDAMSRLGNLPETRIDSSIAGLLNRQEETYKYLLHYLAEGYEDSGRKDMVCEISTNLHFINDSILRNHITKDSSDIYSSLFRLERVRQGSLSKRLDECHESYARISDVEDPVNIDIKDFDSKLEDLFNYVMTMFGSSKNDYKLLTDTATDVKIPFSIRAQIVSALLVGNLKWFDRYAFLSLIDVFESDTDRKMSARSLVALVFIASAHPGRVKNDPLIKAKLMQWDDSLPIYRDLREVVTSIIRSRDTQRISSKMQNEVLPELMKLRPEVLDRLKNASETSDLEMLDENPEWEELLSKSGLDKKLKDLTEMQMEGGDVMMMAFSNLKSFPFFKQISNWFLPFSSVHHEITKDNSLSPMLTGLLDMEGVMCDSDKYSFVFSLQSMPEEQRKIMTSRLDGQMSQLKEMIDERKLKSTVPEFDNEATRFVRDIYRFSKLYSKRNDFPDPFEKPLDFISLPYFGGILSDTEMLNIVGEFYFKRQYYAESIPMFLQLDRATEGQSGIWEKLGYCYNALGNITKALEWYRKAELLNPESLWLIKRMAQCFHLQKDFRNSKEYFRKALEIDRDNFHLIMGAAGVELDSGNYKNALSHYYHADYLRPGYLPVQRALAWCEFLEGNFEKSLNLYESILSNDTHSPSDKMNAGHVNFVIKNVKRAIELYRDASSDSVFGINGLEKGIREDRHEIERLGGNVYDLDLILEKLRGEQSHY